MNVFDAANAYCEAHSTPLESVLNELIQETVDHVPGSQMLSGLMVGKLLMQYSRLLSPEYVLELGTYTGFSAICLAQGLSQGGKVITMDNDDRWQPIREKYWSRAGLSESIEYVHGPALDNLSDIAFSPQLVFLDADKKNYLNYVELLVPKMKRGSIIIADNVLYKNEVLEDAQHVSKNAEALKLFNQTVLKDNRLDVLMLPVRDGITLLTVK